MFFCSIWKRNYIWQSKKLHVTNFTGGQVLVMIKNIREQKHLGLNNMLLNYYKWRQIIHCKRFCYRQWAGMTLVSIKIYINGFPKRNFFDQWKSYWRKTCLLWSRPGLLSVPSAISFTNLSFAKCKFTKKCNETKYNIYSRDITTTK